MALTQNQSDVNELYKKYLGREGDFNTPGGASYWSDKVGTSGHSLAEIENALKNSQEGKKFATTGKVNIGGLDSSKSTYSQGQKTLADGTENPDYNVWAGHFQPGGALAGGSSSHTANQIAKNTGQTGLSYFQQADSNIGSNNTGGGNTGGDNTGGGDTNTNNYLTSDDLTSWWDALDKPWENKTGGKFDQFKEFMGLLSGMNFGGGGNTMWPQYGYGGYGQGPGGVQSANPFGNFMNFMNAFSNIGSGDSSSSNVTNQQNNV
tara:strand:- start:3080 stop:3868 length:789 start_codon:yes stop_codon:yes gene_type:complete